MNSNLLGEELNNFLDVGATQPELLKIASVIPVSLCSGTCFRPETERNDEVIFRILLSPFPVRAGSFRKPQGLPLFIAIG